MKDKTVKRQNRKSKRSNGSTRKGLTKKVKLHLPADYPWKVLSWLRNDLAEFLGSDENDLLSQIIRDRDFFSLTLLSELWGLQNVSITLLVDNPHVSTTRAKYQLSALLKKFQFSTDKDKRESKALEKFLAAEDVCQAYNRCGYEALCWSKTEADASIFTDAKTFLQKLLGTVAPSLDILTLWSRHGPGSNLDTYKGQSSIYYKYENWPYSCTKDAIQYARFLISTNKRWLGYLEDSYRKRNNISAHVILDQQVFWDNVLKVVKGNRITFVPKDAHTERSIAIEPTMNLMLQLGVDGFIRKRLKRWDIDLDSQKKNQVLAFRGSINPTSSSYVTLDLAAASDSISLKLCELLLPPEWYSYLCKIRSPQGVIGDEVVIYNKISSMGNGFTFALESAIFASLCYGAIMMEKGVCDFKDDLSIFGDDLIVKQDVVNRVVHALGIAGFQLNTEKSFLSGLVKESCGTDWVHGKPVRPVFFKTFPTDVMALFTDINRLKRVLLLRWGIEKSLTVMNMTKWIPEQFRSISGPYSDTDFDSYMHCRQPIGGYKNYMWRHPRLVKKSIQVSGKNFLLRKLMHDLRGTNEKFDQFVKAKRKEFTNGGSRFTVYKSHSYTVSKSYSATSTWSSNYAEEILG